MQTIVAYAPKYDSGRSTKKMEIRLATDQDWNVISEIYCDVRRRQFKWVNPASICQSDLRRDSEGEEIHVVVEGRNVLGFLSVWAPESFVHHLFIDPAFQGKGAGSKLLRFASQTYPYPLSLKCKKQNEMAVGFYINKGWRVLKEGLSEDGAYLLMEFRAPNKAVEVTPNGAPHF